MTRTPSSTVSGTLSAAWTTSQTKGTQRMSCRRVCRCCLSWALMLCSPWFCGKGQCVETLAETFKSTFNCYHWSQSSNICTMFHNLFSNQTLLMRLLSASLVQFVTLCLVPARGVLRTSRSSTRSCSTSRPPLISPPPWDTMKSPTCKVVRLIIASRSLFNN